MKITDTRTSVPPNISPGTHFIWNKKLYVALDLDTCIALRSVKGDPIVAVSLAGDNWLSKSDVDSFGYQASVVEVELVIS